MTQAGYSGKPVAAKLGLKTGIRVGLHDAPPNYEALLGDIPDGVVFDRALARPPYAFIHAFAAQRADLQAAFPMLHAALSSNGALWISWPKGASKLPTDLTENVIREIGLANGLVDVKVIAVDSVWSGLKFVFRLSDRPS